MVLPAGTDPSGRFGNRDSLRAMGSADTQVGTDERASARRPRRPGIAPALLLRAAWAPAAVFLAHRVGSRSFDVYAAIPWWDAAAHFAGGVAVAQGISVLATEAVRRTVREPARGAVHVLLVAGLTSLVILLWEVQEFLRDRWFGTRFQQGLEDTMFDILLGFAGAALVIAPAAMRGVVGRSADGIP